LQEILNGVSLSSQSDWSLSTPALPFLPATAGCHKGGTKEDPLSPGACLREAASAKAGERERVRGFPINLLTEGF